MKVNVTISGNVNFFVPALTGNAEEAKQLLYYYEEELKDCQTEEAVALLDFLRDFLEECQEENSVENQAGREAEKRQVDENVDVMIVEPGKPACLMKLPLALELMEPIFHRTSEPVEGTVPTYDFTMCYSGEQVIPVGNERFLFGKAMICKKASDGNYLSMSGDEVHDVIRIFEMLTVTLCADGKEFPAFRI